MNRIEFFRQLTGGLLLSGIAGLQTLVVHKKKPEKKLLYKGRIRGTHYYDARQCTDMLQAGAPLNLTRESHNRHDSKAIALYFENYKLGYIPREDNKILCKIMDQDITAIEAQVTQCYVTDHGYIDIAFRLYAV